ncbi:MAG: ribonuclease III [Bacteroidales bacterium]|nr:ribonuclease III [Bacteroidales bacterium]
MFYNFRKKPALTLIHDRRLFRRYLTALLGFRPGNLSVYEKAFIHRSATQTIPGHSGINNERLEFLGDSILDAVLSEYFFRKFPLASEGELTRLRSRLVNREQLNKLAETMGLNSMLVSHINKTINTRHVYGDSLEALIGAVFIDRGYRSVKKFILKEIIDKHFDLAMIMANETDFKSRIYQWGQKLNKEIEFVSDERWNPAEKTVSFKTSLMVGEQLLGEGEGRSKKESEQLASLNGWELIIRKGYTE